MKKYSGVFWVIGLCAFVALMCSGIAWLLGLIGVTAGFLGTLKMIAGIVLTITAVISGWVWLSSCSLNKTFKTVLQVLFVIFAVLAILGYLNIGI